MNNAIVMALIGFVWAGGAIAGERVLSVGITSGIAAVEPANKHDEATTVTGILHPQSVNADGSMARPIATGPFQVESWEKGGGAVLRRFGAYRPRRDGMSGLTDAKRAQIDTLKFVTIEDRGEARQALLDDRPIHGGAHLAAAPSSAGQDGA